MRDRLTKWFEKQSINLLKKFATRDLLIEIDSFGDRPGNSSNIDNILILKDYHGNGVSDYYTSVRAVRDKDKEVRVSPDGQFNAVEFTLTGVPNAESIVVTGVFDTEEGTETDTVLVDCANFPFGYSFPMSLSVDEMAQEAQLRVETTGEVGVQSILGRLKGSALSWITSRDLVQRDQIRMGMPVPSTLRESAPPIFLISIDTLRYDTEKSLQPLLNALGEDVVVPTEPRTNGHWTAPSHGSMFTGVHPGEHKYLGDSGQYQHPIHPDLTTIPELLTNEGYKCSGLASHARVIPEAGFGRGFFRYRFQNMTSWLERRNDARAAVDKLLEWIELDRNKREVFYFMHVFDPHQPYIPPHPTQTMRDFDLSAIKSLAENGLDEMSDGALSKVRSFYDRSVTYTANQIARLVEMLKLEGVFDDALIILTGDHGELFGENGQFGHETLHYHNIRPFMAVKPPATAGWSVPDTASTIDLLPTIATAAGAPVPDQCQGTAWQAMEKERKFRITEKIKPDTYQISIEKEGKQAIFTYPEQYPERPDLNEEDPKPIRTEYHELSELKDGDYSGASERFSEAEKRQLQKRAEEFISESPVTERTHVREVRPDEETDDQLRHLGYK